MGDVGSTMRALYGLGRKSALCGGSTLSSCRRLGKGLTKTTSDEKNAKNNNSGSGSARGLDVGREPGSALGASRLAVCRTSWFF